MLTERREGGVPWTLGGFALAHLVIFAVVFQTVYIVGNSGIPLYYADMSRLFAGQVPYRDFVLEYPPFAIVFFGIPRLFGAAFTTYYRGFQVEIVLCDLIILLMLDAIARARRERTVPVLGAYTLLTLTVGPIIAQQFDLFAAAFVLGAVYFAGRNQRAPLWIVLALGTLTKLFPVLLAPAFLLRELRRREWRRVGAAAGIAMVTVLVVMLPLLIVAPTAIRTFFAYHAKRGTQVESTYAGLLLIADKLRWIYVGIENSFGSWNVSGQYADAAAAISTFVLVGALALIFVFLYRVWGELPVHAESRAAIMHTLFVESVLLVVLAVLVTSKVLSPQYLIWALPLVPLVEGRNRRVVWGLFALVGVMTFYVFPTHYEQLVMHDSGAVIAVLVLRNLFLVVLAILVADSVRESVRVAAHSVPAGSGLHAALAP
jgi:uncharacterized membrane protein